MSWKSIKIHTHFPYIFRKHLCTISHTKNLKSYNVKHYILAIYAIFDKSKNFSHLLIYTCKISQNNLAPQSFSSVTTSLLDTDSEDTMSPRGKISQWVEDHWKGQFCVKSINQTTNSHEKWEWFLRWMKRKCEKRRKQKERI